jgi:hypothetical protein
MNTFAYLPQLALLSGAVPVLLACLGMLADECRGRPLRVARRVPHQTAAVKPGTVPAVPAHRVLSAQGPWATVSAVRAFNPVRTAAVVTARHSMRPPAARRTAVA